MDPPEQVEPPPATWEPPLPATEEWIRIYQQQLAEFAEWLEMDPPLPEVDLVRFIRPEELGEVHSACLQEQGFGARATFDGGIAFDDLPPEQLTARDEARYRCQARYPVHPQYWMSLDEGQIRVVYDYRVETLAPCLRQRGFDPGEPPTWETFLETFDTEDEWYPYDSVNPESVMAWEEINNDCPQWPPWEEIYGEGW